MSGVLCQQETEFRYAVVAWETLVIAWVVDRFRSFIYSADGSHTTVMNIPGSAHDYQSSSWGSHSLREDTPLRSLQQQLAKPSDEHKSTSDSDTAPAAAVSDDPLDEAVWHRDETAKQAAKERCDKRTHAGSTYVQAGNEVFTR